MILFQLNVRGLAFSKMNTVLGTGVKLFEPYFLYGEKYFTLGRPAIFPREEKIGTEIQNNRYARFFIPQRDKRFVEVAPKN